MKILAATLALFAAAAIPAFAQSHGSMHAPAQTQAQMPMQHSTPAQGQMPMQGKMPMADGARSDGEVRKIDKGAGKITLRHGPIANLDMPPMTMVFHVQDRAMLDRVQVGEKVRLAPEDPDDALTVTAIEPAK